MSTESTPTPSPSEIFRGVLNAAAAKQISGIVAALQAQHYKRLVEEGINEPTALELTERTTSKLLEIAPPILTGVAQVVTAVGTAGQPIIENFDDLMRVFREFAEWQEEGRR